MKRSLISILLLTITILGACAREDDVVEPDSFSFIHYPGARYLGELTEVTREGTPWWSVCFEAFGAFDGVVGNFASPETAGTAYVLLHHLFGEAAGVPGAWGHAIGGMGAITQAMAEACREKGVDEEREPGCLARYGHRHADRGGEGDDPTVVDRRSGDDAALFEGDRGAAMLNGHPIGVSRFFPSMAPDARRVAGCYALRNNLSESTTGYGGLRA